MSRGHGKVQRALLALLSELRSEHRPELWLCISKYDLGLGEHLESRRRAARTLAAEGRIELRHATDRDSRGALNRLMFARLPLSAEEAAEARVLRREYIQHQRVILNEALPMAVREQEQKWIRWYRSPMLARGSIEDIQNDSAYNGIIWLEHIPEDGTEVSD